MKTCPQCERSFDDSFFFCLEDGTVLPSATAGETQQLFIKSAVTEIFSAKLQNIESNPSEKNSGKNTRKLVLVLLPSFFIIGLGVTAFLVSNSFRSADKAPNRNQASRNERVLSNQSNQSNKNSNASGINQPDNSQSSAKSNSANSNSISSNSANNAKTNSFNSLTTNVNSEKPIDNAGSSLPKLRQGMIYARARRMLIANGWQAVNFPPNRKLSGSMDYLVNTLGFYEVEDCSGTGAGYCRFLFNNAEGKKLVVVTVNNEENSPGGPVLSSWTLED